MPDAVAVSPVDRLPDGGPVYVETPADLTTFSGLIAEPWNTASAGLFVVIAVGWAWALRGHYRDHPFLTICLPILFVGGVGGVLFHGLRRYRAFFLMDVAPIFVLAFAVSIWFWVRLGPKLRYLFGLIALLALLQILSQWQLPIQWKINVSYASLGMLVLAPLALALMRTRCRYGGWAVTALACFAIAWLCRIADTIRPPALPMGTHWLWHLFGALTTAALSVYIYRIEMIPLKKPESTPLAPREG